MSHFFTKIAKISLWILVPLVLTSGTKFESTTSEGKVFSGEYLLRASGTTNQNLIGTVNFETITRTKQDGVRFSILKLTLKNTDDATRHTIQFLISKPKKLGQISKGSYQVSKKSQGLLNNFDGVFGFADIYVLGEMPFFAKSGEIKINHINDERLGGSLKFKLKNAKGQFIDLSGDFIATKK